MTRRGEWEQAYGASPRRDADFETMSGLPVEAVYGAEEDEFPGQFPYTRGPYASMYRSKLWTMRLFAGFGTAEDTNARFREILRAGGDGLSTAFDLPTLMGRDSDDPHSAGEVGKCGVAVDTLADMEDLYAGIDLGTVTTSMTINSPAAMLLAMYVAVAEGQGVERARLGGTIQNDILKEYQAQKEFIFPPRPSMRIVTDMVRFCAAEMPRWHPISISGYHIREAGSTAAQELPTEKSARIALRTQQVIAHETGVPHVADPLGGSHYVEWMTEELERQAEEVFAHLDERGQGSMLEGVYSGIETGWFQQEIAEAAYQLERKLSSGRRIVVGVNRFTESDDEPLAILTIGSMLEERQLKRLDTVRRSRSDA